jgi:hypothetical protein
MNGEGKVSAISPLKKTILVVITALVLLVFWPWLGNPFGYVHFRDSVRTSIPIALIFGNACATYEQNYTYYDPGPNCYRFDEPRKFKGIWLYEFEGSTFLENATVVPPKRPKWGTTPWLNYDPSRIHPSLDKYGYDAVGQCHRVQAYKISFIGRLNPYGGGHMGLFNGEIWPERILSVQPLPSPSCAGYRE